MEEKLRASEIAIQAGADFIKTSTGSAAGGAIPADVALLRGVAGARCGIKASGGIRTVAQLRTLLEAGANRIGCSASVVILRELGADYRDKGSKGKGERNYEEHCSGVRSRFNGFCSEPIGRRRGNP